jgi:hypothetical protein
MTGLIEELSSDEPAKRNHPNYWLRKGTRPIGRTYASKVDPTH